MSKAINIRGHRYGKLIAKFPIRPDTYGIRWACKCDCGRWATRLVAQLRHTVRQGSKPCCSRCLSKLRSHQRGGLRVARRKLWDDEQTLYGHVTMDRMDRDVAFALWKETGIAADDPDRMWAERQIEQLGSINLGQVWTPREGT